LSAVIKKNKTTTIFMKIRVFQIIVLTAIISLAISGCGNKNRESSVTEEQGYINGTYCAEVDYYNSETGTSSTYTLEVEIENNELTIIHWPNGGWLDDSHFTPTDISSGEASFTSDRGIEYTVRIIGNEGDCSVDTYVTDDDAIKTQDEEYEQQQESQDNEGTTNSEENENSNE
jgi:hypothetical protein